MKKLSLIFLALLAFGPIAWAQTIDVSDASELTSNITNGAQIRLMDNITLSSYLNIPNNIAVTIDLNGKTLQRDLSNAINDGCVIVVAQSGSLTLTGGNITENESTDHGGGGIVNYGTVNLSGSVSITGNTCHTKGAGIWSDGTLNMEGNIQVKNNNSDDVFLKTGKVINTGTLTGDPSSIGINMETPGVFTYGYEAHNAGNTIHFFASGNVNQLELINGEGKMYYAYYEASWNATTKQVEYTRRTVPDGQAVSNICGSAYSSGGELNGGSLWFVADGTGSTANGLTCTDGTTVNLILCDNAQITINEGLFAKAITTLNIYCQSYGDNMGKLITQNPHDNFSGIGAREDSHAGTINIHGGDITARGGKWGAGIGGGYNHNCGTITIYGGKISATGGGDSNDNGGAGIGCGYRGQGGSITIYGGEITATGGSNGAGIGGGRASAQTTITINAGTITATGGAPTNAAGAAGIGGGTEGTSGEITINGGTIIANGTKGGAGIGTGSWSNTEATIATITITGGNIRAYGGDFSVNGNSPFAAGAGIGSGAAYVNYYNLGGDINISGGTIYAEGGRGGYHSSSSSYHGGGAGIGSGGLANSGGQITISGGTIEAKGGECSGSSLYDGAGIGGGHESSGGLITISGGRVTVTAGGSGAKDIGPGYGATFSTTPTIKDGAQVILAHDGVTVTVEKYIEHYSGATGLGNTDGWYFIASPISTNVEPSNVTNMLTETYDLYRLNNTTWENYKALTNDPEPQPLHPDFTTLNNGKGYLYANSNDDTLKFTGIIKIYDAAYEVRVDAGFNLVGNPYTFDTYVNRPYYKMNEARKGVELVSDNAAIKPCDGVVINANSDGNVIFTQTPQQSQATGGNLLVTLAQTNNTRDTSTGSMTAIDNAIVSFNEGSTLPKFRFGENAEIYIPQGNEDYAIAFSEKQGELPLNFKATEDGEYTITVNPENMEMDYLHLIDNITGVDVDLLAPELVPEPVEGREGPASYTFTAKTTDYTSRFRLVFSANGVSEDADDNNEAFAFISNGNIIINGEGMLQMIDMMGRVVWVGDAMNRVSTNGMTSGVYVLRLINGEKVSTQKIVIN